MSRDIHELFCLESEIMQQRGNMSADDAHYYYNRLCTCYEDFMNAHCSYLENTDFNFPDYMCIEDHQKLESCIVVAECVQKNTFRLQEMLKKYFQPAKSTTHQENQTQSAVQLNSLFQKQRFFVDMIDSPAPVDQLSMKDAELQYEHVSQYYEKFIANQSEIMTLITDNNAYSGQVNFAKGIQNKVFLIKKQLQGIISPSKPSVKSEPKSSVPSTRAENLSGNLNDESKKKSETDEVTSLSSLLEKQKSLINELDTMKSYKQTFESCLTNFQSLTVSFDKKQVELSLKHLPKLKKWFTSNQSKIEEHVDEYELYKQKKIATETQTKLKKIQKEYEVYLALCEYSTACLE